MCFDILAAIFPPLVWYYLGNTQVLPLQEKIVKNFFCWYYIGKVLEVRLILFIFRAPEIPWPQLLRQSHHHPAQRVLKVVVLPISGQMSEQVR